MTLLLLLLLLLSFYGSSLDNMYKELGSTIEGFKHPGHGNLIGWAEQGQSVFSLPCLQPGLHCLKVPLGYGAT